MPGGRGGVQAVPPDSAASASFRGSFRGKEVILQRVTLNRSDKSLNCTYSRYSPLQGLRAP